MVGFIGFLFNISCGKGFDITRENLAMLSYEQIRL